MTTSADSVHGRIKRVLVDSLKLEGLTPEEISNDQALFGEGLGLDSVDALELVLGIEREFGIEVRSADMDRSAFASVDTLAAWVELARTVSVTKRVRGANATGHSNGPHAPDTLGD